MKRFLVGLTLLSLTLATGCENATTPVGAVDAGGGEETQDAGCVPETDQALCARLGRVCGAHSATDNCGVVRNVASCGSCPDNQACDTAKNACVDVCVPETNEAFCERNAAACGTVTALDNCGTDRTWDCGGCGANEECDAVTHQCKVICETDAELCTAAAAECGPLTVTDRCGQERTVAECGPCASEAEHCESGTCKVCVPETDDAFCSRLQKECGSYSDVDNCGLPRTAADCGECASGKGCDKNACVTLEPTNEDCSTAQALTFDSSGTVVFQGSTQYAGDDGQPKCGYTDNPFGADIFYVFTLTSVKNVKIEVTPTPGSLLAPIISVYDACPRRGSTMEGDCAGVKKAGEPVGTALRQLNPGTYWVRVDGYANSRGPFEIKIDIFDPLPAPANDTCTNVQALTFDAAGVATVTGTTFDAVDDYQGGCQTASDGGDAVYSFTLASPASVAAKVTRGRAANYYDPMVYIRTACSNSPADEKVCAEDGWTGTAVGGQGNLPAGTYYVFVDGLEGSGGPYTLEVTRSAPIANDTCTGAAPLTFDPVTHTATVSGDTSAATNDVNSSCEPTTTGDLVWKFTTTATKRLEVQMAAAAGSWLLPTLSLRGDCADEMTELACGTGDASGLPGQLIVPNLPAGTYYLLADGVMPSAGAFTLSVKAYDPPPPPANDTCAGAETLAFDALGRAYTSGDTSIALPHDDGTCMNALDGNDLVYFMRLNTAAYATITVKRDPTFPAFEPAIYLRTGGCASTADADQLGCRDDSWRGGSAKIVNTNLAAGDYWIHVDSPGHTMGAFDLEVVLQAPILNDRCSGTPAPIVFDANGQAHLTGDTSLVASDTDSSCSVSQTSGGDLVYSFTLASEKKLTINARPAAGSNWTPAIHLRKSCDEKSSEMLCDKELGPTQLDAVVDGMLPGTYYLWVDSAVRFGAGNGAFEVDLTLTDTQAAINDTCTRAEELVVQNGYVEVDGNTATANDNYAGNCGADPHVGGDRVYTFTLSAPSAVSARVEGAAGTSFLPALYLRSDCSNNAAAAELACAIGTRDDKIATIGKPVLPAGTYYLIVDGASYFGMPHSGAYKLRMFVTPPQMNDSCTAPNTAEPLVFTPTADPAVVHASVVGNTATASDSGSGYCVGNGPTGADVVYALQLTKTSDVKVTLTPQAGSPLVPYVYLRSDCGARETELACRTAAAGKSAGFLRSRLAAGTYYLWVDGAGADGTYTLSVDVIEPQPAYPNDNCTAATPLTFDATGKAFATGTTVSAANDYSGSCGSAMSLMTGGDVVYQLTLATDAKLVIEASNSFSGSSDIRPAVYLRKSCASGAPADELACAIEENQSGVAEATVSYVPAGTYYVIVDSLTGGGDGDFVLEIEKMDPIANDTCSLPEPLVFDPATGAATVIADTSEGRDDAEGTCVENGTGSDLVYSFTTTTEKNFKAVISPAASSGLKPILYLRSNCTGAASEVRCGYLDLTGRTMTLEQLRLPAGTWYLFVDSYSPTWQYNPNSGAFSMLVTLEDPPPVPANDTCVGAIDIPIDAQTRIGTVSGTTSAARNQYSGTCAGTSVPMNGPDTVYKFTLADMANVQARLTRVTTGGTAIDPAVYIRKSCDSAAAADEVVCGNYTNDPFVVTRPAALPAGTYYVIVDGASSSHGDFQLEIFTTPLAVADSCINPGAITLDASGHGQVAADTTAAGEHVDGTCFSNSGRDLVYTFTTTGTKNVTVTMTATGFEPFVHVQSACADLATELACVPDAGASGTAQVFMPLLPAGTYYVWADSFMSTGFGPFQLTVDAVTPPVVANDTCTNPEQLVFAGNMAAVPLLETTSAAKDYTGTCSDGTAASDVVYAFTTSAAHSVVARVTRDATTPGWDPVVYIRKACASDDATQELTCATDGWGMGTTEATLNNLPAGTYYIVVDGGGSSWGKGRLDVALAAPVTGAPANDSCGMVADLQLSNGTPATATASGTTALAIDETWGTCANAAAGDVVYRVVLTDERSIQAKVTPSAGSGTSWPAVYIRSSCGSMDADEELACAEASMQGSIATATVRRAPAGAYYVWVDGGGWGATPGGFTLDVTVDQPIGPTNDSCLHPTSVQKGVAVSGDTLSAANDWGFAGGPCSRQMMGNDLVYSYTPAADGPFTVTVTPSGFEAALWYSVGTCGAATCAQASDGMVGPQTLTINGVAGQTYYLFVDSVSAFGSDNGPFTLVVQ